MVPRRDTHSKGVQELLPVRRTARSALQEGLRNGQGTQHTSGGAQTLRLFILSLIHIQVIPPPGWKAREAGYGSCIDNMLIPGPIEQNTYGKGGIYECLHIQKKSLTYKEYRKKILSFDKISEGKSAEEVEDLVTLHLI